MTSVAAVVADASNIKSETNVEVSYQIVNLLSEQLYASPLKAIEELVVNSWDADATSCFVHVPLTEVGNDAFCAVLDNGIGMTEPDLKTLWHVGLSNKRTDAWKEKAKRKQIGKFGIGKLASYAIAKRVTHLTRSSDGLLAVTVDFQMFTEATQADGTTSPIVLQLKELDVGDFTASAHANWVAEALGIAADWFASTATWTLVLLEDLKPRVTPTTFSKLSWVLRTAMPLASDFALQLNGVLIESSKLSGNFAVRFGVHELPATRLRTLTERTGEQWTSEGDLLKSPSFPAGLAGEVGVATKSLYSASVKSEDLGRSHGFFVRVRNRLINQTDPHFGLTPRSFTTWYNFFAVVEADDLDPLVTAPRDDLEQAEARDKLQVVLQELFNEAREQFETIQRAADEVEKRKKEGSRDFVNPRLVERPIADALVLHRETGSRPQPWTYLQTDISEEELQQLVESLYEETQSRRRYSYSYTQRSADQPLLQFNADESRFLINESHELVLEFYESPQSRRLLELLITAEALLEVYLREQGVSPDVVDAVLARRDLLLRSLAQDQQFSLRAIASSLRDATSDKDNLEIALVASMRALGFVARQISGAGEPDGLATHIAHGSGGVTFTLEAKSSIDVPNLPQLDFAGIRQHYVDKEAQGCLLLAPSYPGPSRGGASQVALRANEQKVSCWTIEELANVVEKAESRHITAEAITEIVLSRFDPDSVTAAVDGLLSEPVWLQDALYRGILQALGDLEGKLSDAPRDVSMIAARLTQVPELEGISKRDVKRAVDELAKASRGMLHVTDEGTVHLRGALEEVERRVAALTGSDTHPRRRGVFRS